MPKLQLDAKTALTGVDAARLFEFIEEQKKLNSFIFQKGFSSSSDDDAIVFNQDLVCEGIQGHYVCYFIGNELGSGSFATVYNIDQCKILYPFEFFQATDATSQVVKRQRHCECKGSFFCSNHNSLDMLDQEFKLTSKTTHLDIHPPILSSDERTSFTIMKKMPGDELYNILNEDYEKKNILPLSCRIELSLALLQAVKKEITDLNLIHMDIKPENIFVDLKSRPLSVHFLDYALSFEVPKGEKKVMVKSHCGSLAYMAPEVIQTKGQYFVSYATDLFSIMRILLLIWGGVDKSYQKMNSYEYINYLPQLNIRSSLFQSIPDLQSIQLKALNLAQPIQEILSKGLSLNPDCRGDIDTVIAEFQKIYDEFSDKKQPGISKNNVGSFFGRNFKLEERLNPAAMDSMLNCFS